MSLVEALTAPSYPVIVQIVTPDRDIAHTLHLRRDSPVAPYLQLQSQLQYLIAAGQTSPSQKLPSIREVARILRTSPTTVSKAYANLKRDGLIVSVPGSGFFVSGQHAASEHPKYEHLRADVMRLIEHSAADGIGASQLRHIFLTILQEAARSTTKPLVVVVGPELGRTDRLAYDIERRLEDLRASVTHLTLERLKADVSGHLPELQKAAAVVSLVFNITSARSVLSPHSIEVIPLHGLVSPESAIRIASIPPKSGVAILASTDAFVDGMITAVTTINPTVSITSVLSADALDPRQAHVKRARILIYGTLANQRAHAMQDGFDDTIELVYLPDPSSIATLREQISQRAGPFVVGHHHQSFLK